MAWQHVQTSLGGSLNETNMVAVDKLVKAITDDGGQAILDIVNGMIFSFSFTHTNYPSTTMHVGTAP
jgi:hypothetical protein